MLGVMLSICGAFAFLVRSSYRTAARRAAEQASAPTEL